MVTSVIDVKQRGNGQVFVATDTSLSNFPRPYVYGEKGQHHVSLTCSDKDNSNSSFTATICGNALASGDRIAEKVILHRLPKQNELLVIHDAGAYGYSMSSVFSGRVRPAEILSTKNEIFCIRQRESHYALLERTGFLERKNNIQENPFHAVNN